jgi:hypothetical protein
LFISFPCRERGRHALCGYLVGLGQQVRVRRQQRRRRVAEARGHDVHRDAVRERERRRGVAQDVKGAGRDPGRLAVLPEPLGEPLRMDRVPKLVGEDQVAVPVGIEGEVALEPLGVAEAAQCVDGL